jgi:hypothetical protein
MDWRKAIYWGSAAMLAVSIYRIGLELSEVWGELQ